MRYITMYRLRKNGRNSHARVDVTPTGVEITDREGSRAALTTARFEVGADDRIKLARLLLDTISRDTVRVLRDERLGNLIREAEIILAEARSLTEAAKVEVMRREKVVALVERCDACGAEG